MRCVPLPKPDFALTLKLELPSIFPAPESADEYGIVAVSRDLNCEMLLDAYTHGIFPWPCENSTVLWSSPARRGVLFLDRFHLPRSLQRELKRMPFELRINSAFEQVIANCAAVERPDQEGTWITPKIIRTYCRMHQRKMAHSFEAFLPDGTLAGGLYGLVCGKIFCGESMFFHRSGASKFAFVKLVETLKSHGFMLIDTQMVTGLTASFGAEEIERKEYLRLLSTYGEPISPFEWNPENHSASC